MLIVKSLFIIKGKIETKISFLLLCFTFNKTYFLLNLYIKY